MADEKEKTPPFTSDNDPITANKEEDNEEEDERKGRSSDETGMKPWEQHSAVISIPRFDYKAPTSLLLHSHSGFLVTCPIKREKSATKEAISILDKYIFENIGAKKRKLCSINEESVNSVEIKDAGDSRLSIPELEPHVDKHDLSLVKLTRNGLLLFTFPKDKNLPVTDIVSNIMKSVESGCLKSPSWCHRIFPVQATCILDEKELQATVSKLVTQFMNDHQKELVRPLKFAIGYNRRGIEETEPKNKDATSSGVHAIPLLDRNKCFSVVAAAVKDVIPDSEVDLKLPELSVLVELLPVSGIPDGSIVIAVSVLPLKLVSSKPRLCIKSLVSDTRNQKKG